MVFHLFRLFGVIGHTLTYVLSHLNPFNLKITVFNLVFAYFQHLLCCGHLPYPLSLICILLNII